MALQKIYHSIWTCDVGGKSYESIEHVAMGAFSHADKALTGVDIHDVVSIDQKRRVLPSGTLVLDMEVTCENGETLPIRLFMAQEDSDNA